ncbi:MAG: hypothetical protein CMG55_01700 [Candidatus Marinimicrobia bacterium]|nr:hypothetical protein [Candidatus Neomarinimicrobiota bacterium]|tara:strand:- start:2660 stop:3082 length:423 start_codon:yes stop_codon:yes gene_type:complete
MNILILQGPNLNLLGLKSSHSKNHLTLNKLNNDLRNYIKNKGITLKFLQTHKDFQAINFLQRNRNKADGLLFIPTSWAKNHQTIFETIQLINIKTSIIYFDKPFNFGTTEKDSIMTGKNIKPFSGDPLSSCLKGLDQIIK